MNAGLRLHTDLNTFDQWAQALPGLTWPAELGPQPPLVQSPGDGDIGAVKIPPIAAVSLSLHGCAEVVITVQVWSPTTSRLGVFAVQGDLCASLTRTGEVAEVGLFQMCALITEVVRVIPRSPDEICPPEHTDGLNDVGVRLVVIPRAVNPARFSRPELEVSEQAGEGWQTTLVGGDPTWRSWSSGPRLPGSHQFASGPAPAGDARRQLADELRLALTRYLGAGFLSWCGPPSTTPPARSTTVSSVR